MLNSLHFWIFVKSIGTAKPKYSLLFFKWKECYMQFFLWWNFAFFCQIKAKSRKIAKLLQFDEIFECKPSQNSEKMYMYVTQTWKIIHKINSHQMIWWFFYKFFCIRSYISNGSEMGKQPISKASNSSNRVVLLSMIFGQIGVNRN